MKGLWNLKTKCARKATKSAIKLANQIERALEDECAAFLRGEIATQTQIAKRFGVTRACISRRVCQMRQKRGMPLSAKQTLTRKTYGLRQLIVAQTRKPTRLTDIQKEIEALWRIDHD